MKLLIILLCLFSERFLIHAYSYQRFFWFEKYYQKIKKIAETNPTFANPWLLLALIILPIVSLSLVIYLLLSPILFGLIGFLLSLLIFYYCLGPQNIFYPKAQSDTQNHNELVGDYFVLVNTQLFSLVFWYIIAGPIAALTYRLVVLCRDLSSVSVQANELIDLLEWIPARLTVLLFLLVGNFQRGVVHLKHYIFARPDSNSDMLRICGMHAVQANDTEEVPMPVAEGLVEYAIILMLVFIALLYLFTTF